jgi:hypothetical protein
MKIKERLEAALAGISNDDWVALSEETKSEIFDALSESLKGVEDEKEDPADDARTSEEIEKDKVEEVENEDEEVKIYVIPKGPEFDKAARAANRLGLVVERDADGSRVSEWEIPAIPNKAAFDMRLVEAKPKVKEEE